VIPVGEWQPDLPGLAASQEALNVIPDSQGYRSFPSLEAISSAADARVQGFWAGESIAGASYDIAGTNNKLLLLVTGSTISWSDITKGATTYSCDSTEWWEFAQWGDRLISVNGKDAPQKYSLGSAANVDLGGSPPTAKHIAIVRDFVVLGNITSNPQRVQWSGINDYETWTGSATNLADSQDLLGDHGVVQKILGGEYGTIFMERAIYRMTFAGLPFIFQFDKIVDDIGALSPQSVVRVGDTVWFLGSEGFYMLSGAQVQPIGQGKIDRFFLDDLDASNAHRVQGLADPLNHIVMWCYPNTQASSGTPNRIILYNWAVNKWAHAEIDTEMLCRFVSPGYTLESLDNVSSSLDALPASLDDPAWMGGRLSYAAFNTSHVLSTFSGDALDATVDTQEVQPNPEGRAHCLSVRPIVDGGTTVSVRVGSRNLQTESVTLGTPVTQNSSGECPSRVNARYMRFRIQNSGNFSFIIGAKPTIRPEGTR
jgi:hypothetical protein